MKPSNRLPTVLVAILKAGMAYLPLDAEFPMARVKHVLQEAKPFAVIIEQGGKHISYRFVFSLTVVLLNRFNYLYCITD